MDTKALQDDTARMARQFEAKVSNQWTMAQDLDTGARISTVMALYAEYKQLSEPQIIKVHAYI